jgi:hypothetical protein
VLDGHGVLREEELAGLAAPDCLDGYRASGVFRLLADCGPALVRYRDLFTAIRAAEMERAENVLLAAARRWPEPATAERILASVPDFLPNSPPATRTKAADAFLRGTADTIATMDLRFCGSDAALAALLAELLRRLPDPAPIRAIVREFNATVVPGHRKTAPFLARHLSTSPLFTRPSIGRYRLARP